MPGSQKYPPKCHKLFKRIRCLLRNVKRFQIFFFLLDKFSGSLIRYVVCTSSENFSTKKTNWYLEAGWKLLTARHLVYLRPCPAPEHLVTAYIYILRVFTCEAFATLMMLINNPFLYLHFTRFYMWSFSPLSLCYTFTILLAQRESNFRVEK